MRGLVTALLAMRATRFAAKVLMVSTRAGTSARHVTGENKQRFVLFPLKHPKVWEMYKKAEASFWTAEEIALAVRPPAPAR